MGRIYTDAERLLNAAELSKNGRHGEAAATYQRMGNECRKPSQKKQLWGMAEESRRKQSS